MVPQFGGATNTAGAVSQPGVNTSGVNPNDQGLGNTNAFDRDDWRTNRFGGGTNPFSPVFGTNADVAVTAQDQVLLHQVRHRLRSEARDGSMALSIAVQNGVVTLTGASPSAEEAQEFVTQVQQTPGVVSVVNHLQVVPGMPTGRGFESDQGFSTADRELLGQVRRRMGRHDFGGGASESVHIVARNGVVTLFGFVSSTAEKQALEAAVQSTPGVVQVNDELRLVAMTGGSTGTQDNGTGATGAATNSPGGTVSGFSTGNGFFSVAPAAVPPGSNTNTNGTNLPPAVPR